MTEFQSGAENYLLPIAITSIEGSGRQLVRIVKYI